MMGFINMLRGHVAVRVETSFPERFLNICARHGVLFWDLERLDECTLRVHMLPEGYKKVSGFADKLGCKLKIETKLGAPFFFRRFRKRYALVLGGLIGAAFLYYMSLFVWEFEVIGAETVPKTVILQNLSEIGVGVGTYVPDIDIDSLQNEMLLRVGKLSWITVNVKGSRATIEVRERIPKPVMIDETLPCNITASKAGVVESIDTLNGSAKVTVGQTVEEGQLLVSGIVDSSAVGARFVRADARIKARTWYDTEGRLLTKASGKEYTGVTKTRNVFVLAGRRFPFYGDGAIPFDKYDKIVTGKLLRLPPGLTLPVALITEHYSEYTKTEMMTDSAVSEEQLRTSLSIRMYEFIGDGEIIDKTIETAVYDGVVVGQVKMECLEEIAQRADVLTGMAIDNTKEGTVWNR